MDKLTDCRKCGSDACYEQSFTPEGSTEEITTWTCMGCGFTTSTLMTEGSTIVTNLKETSPSLYVDLLSKDDKGYIWAPATITVPEKGMVFLDGSNKGNWTWSAVKAITITEEDRKAKEFPADQKFKMDMQNRKMFGQDAFMDAVDHIGFFQVVAG